MIDVTYRSVSFKQVPAYALERLLTEIESYHISSIDILLAWIEDGSVVSLPSGILPSDMPLLK